MSHRAWLSVVWTVLGGVSLCATVVVPSSLREMAADASLIVRGHITDVRALPTRGRGVETVATVSVEAVIKGDAVPFVAVRVPGGTVGRYRYVMVGAPTFRVNDRAVFFLARGTDNGWRPVRLSAGVVRVLRDPASGTLSVNPPILNGPSGEPGPVVRGDDRRRPLSVRDFESLVHLAVAAGQRDGAGEPR